jgi:hypothetical protein
VATAKVASPLVLVVSSQRRSQWNVGSLVNTLVSSICDYTIKGRIQEGRISEWNRESMANRTSKILLYETTVTRTGVQVLVGETRMPLSTQKRELGHLSRYKHGNPITSVTDPNVLDGTVSSQQHIILRHVFEGFPCQVVIPFVVVDPTCYTEHFIDGPHSLQNVSESPIRLIDELTSVTAS